MKGSSSSDELNLASFVKHTIDCMYFVGVCPFRLRIHSFKGMTPNNFQITIQKARLQTMFTVAYTCTALLASIGDFRESNLKNARSPNPYFNRIYRIVAILTVIHSSAQFWYDSNEFANLASFILQSKENGLPLPNPKLLKRLRVFGFIISGLYVLITMTTFIIGLGLSEGPFAGFSVSQRGRYVLFLENEPAFNKTGTATLQNLTITYQDVFFGVIGATGMFYK